MLSFSLSTPLWLVTSFSPPTSSLPNHSLYPYHCHLCKVHHHCTLAWLLFFHCIIPWLLVILHGWPVTVLDEPFVSKAVESYFVTMNLCFKKAVWWLMQPLTSAQCHGCVIEQFMRAFSVKRSPRDLYLSGCISPQLLTCVRLLLTRWRLLSGGSLDSSKAWLMQWCQWESSWTCMSTISQLRTTSPSPLITSPSPSHQDQIWLSSFRSMVQGSYLCLFRWSCIKGHPVFLRRIGMMHSAQSWHPRLRAMQRVFMTTAQTRSTSAWSLCTLPNGTPSCQHFRSPKGH